MVFRAQVVRVTEKETKTFKKYYEVEFADATGALKLKAWSDSPAAPWAKIAAGILHHAHDEAKKMAMVVEVSGAFSKGDYGVESNDWSVTALADAERAEFFLGSAALRECQRQAYMAIEGYVNGMKDRHFKALCQAFLRECGAEFRRAAAARGNHHARPGGLVEHVYGMMRAAWGLAGAYPELNRDLLLAGVLFHDCGKLSENQYLPDSFEMPFTADAELCGHIALGVLAVENLWRECERADSPDVWPEGKLLHLTHLILSHHGELEWGSPVKPKTMEAQVLHFIDNIDAKLEMMRAARLKAREVAPGVLDRVWPLGTCLVITPDWKVERG